MAYINPEAFDGGLDWIIAQNTVNVYICTAEPTTYGQATTEGAVMCGSKTGLTVTGPAAGSPTGRAVTVPAVTDGNVTCTGTVTATHWAVTDGTSVLIATGSLASSQNVTDLNTFTLGEIDITIPEAA